MVATDPGVEYARRVYDRAIDWYKVAEAKAQVLLTVNGAFVTIVFGLLSGNLMELAGFSSSSGIETWILLSIAVSTLMGAIGSAAACLLSRHQHNIRTDLARLGVDPTTSLASPRWCCASIG